MAEDRTVGWFVEIPKSLRQEFDRLYPGRRNKKILTITAIQRAIRLAPKSLHNLYREAPSGVEPTEVDVQGSSTDTAGVEEERTLDRERVGESAALIGRFRAERPHEDRESGSGD